MPTRDYASLAREAAKANEPLPTGEYDAEVGGAQFKPTKSGDPMWSVRFVVLSGPEKGKAVWSNLVLTPKSSFFFFDKMQALGLGAEFWAANPEEDVVSQTLIGRTAHLTVTLGEFNGRPKSEVDKIAPLLAGTAPQPAAAAASVNMGVAAPVEQPPAVAVAAPAVPEVAAPPAVAEPVAVPAPGLPPGLS